ncbi:MAG: diphosphomevalonate decarboxylase [Bdellovibrio sp. ArHS]|uniref:diphosphomevalonate decarboxylase n=1 Tax=Bdellovibrio sp. ArHS TaxID=1569284 RepID=UPI000582E374|nr:diphosphomevalonate decarboxylase [Bdellovibrio sp. ArHS]KHD89968.1 MAG: diphosphomevalonate decarboxylase [Bdellovibrio sp. ArHS]
MKQVLVSAPSNIALIKYMGKIEGSGNKPTNGSLSYTLENLRTYVRLTQIDEAQDQWKLLVREDLEKMNLSEKGQQRFLKHLQNLKDKWGVTQNFLVESANNFPSDCGLASSASSFAALTLAAAEMFQKINPQPWGADRKVLSELSRQGSGSSCRSLFSPWALWLHEYAEPMNLPVKDLHHIVVVVEDSKKEVSSSEAHKLVTTSPRFAGRVERAEIRLKDLSQALQFDDWHMARQIVWDEFIDMHRLFETSTPSFSYMTDESKKVLEECQKLWNKWQDGPLVTMDAGANVHMLFRNDQKKSFETYRELFQKEYKVLAFEGVKPDVH